MNDRTISNFYRSIRQYAESIKDTLPLIEIRIVWHGGEPLLLANSFFERALQAQSKELKSFLVVNYIQTNLYKVKWDKIEFLHENRFKLSISVDFADEVRVSYSKKESNGIAITAIEELTKRAIPFGIVTVVGNHNVDHLHEKYEWISTRAESWRLIPIFSGGPVESNFLGASGADLIKCFDSIFEARLSSSNPIPIEPIDSYLTTGVDDILMRRRPNLLSRTIENVFVINVNGDLFLRPFAYNPEYCLGNVNYLPISHMLESTAYMECTKFFKDSIRDNCASCDLNGACDKSPVYEHGGFSEGEMGPICVIPREFTSLLKEKVTSAGFDAREISNIIEGELRKF